MIECTLKTRLVTSVEFSFFLSFFLRSRKLCELVAAYTRETLTAAAPEAAERVKVRVLCPCEILCPGRDD